MLMRWYRENPLDGNAIARSIQVGIPPDEDLAISRDNNGSGLRLGFTVPEADREVSSKPISLAKDIAVPGLTLDGFSSFKKIDLGNSSPTKLLKRKLGADEEPYAFRPFSPGILDTRGSNIGNQSPKAVIELPTVR